jgi:hypothetical protein
MCTDMPWATAWYGDVTSLLLPKNISTFYLINDEYVSVDAFLFTMLTRDQPFVTGLLKGSDAPWFNLQMGQLPDGFPQMEGMAIVPQEQILITRSEVLRRAEEARKARETENPQE